MTLILAALLLSAALPGGVARAQEVPRKMVFIPGGLFFMGSDDKGRDERPRRHVYLDPFFIDKYGVTNEAFRKYARPEKDFGKKFNGKKQPIVGVTWYQARDYCRSVKKRLPTEAEWEKAARGPDGSKYPWGNFWISTNVIWKKKQPEKDPPR